MRFLQAIYPVLLAKGSDGTRLLRSHVARANRQWRHFAPIKEVLCLLPARIDIITFLVSTAARVPTWNCLAVHVYGMPTIIGDKSALRQIVLVPQTSMK